MVARLAFNQEVASSSLAAPRYVYLKPAFCLFSWSLLSRLRICFFRFFWKIFLFLKIQQTVAEDPTKCEPGVFLNLKRKASSHSFRFSNSVNFFKLISNYNVTDYRTFFIFSPMYYFIEKISEMFFLRFFLTTCVNWEDVYLKPAFCHN